ncbi:hypothetical protein M440DRAFT_5231, partial [Trichoderma longibrachiatum ATCC 18648]
MSTPTTAQVAITLPHYRYLHHPPSYSSNYRTTTTANALLPPTAAVDHQPALQTPARPPSYYHHHPPAANAGYSLTDGVAQPSQSAPRPPPYGHYSHHDANSSATARLDDSYASAMPTSSTNTSGAVPAPARTAVEDQPSSSSRK